MAPADGCSPVPKSTRQQPSSPFQRVLEADENGDSFHDDEDFEVDAPKRKNRNRGKVSGATLSSCESQFTGAEVRRVGMSQNRGSSRRRTDGVSVDEQDKPYVCDSKRRPTGLLALLGHHVPSAPRASVCSMNKDLSA